MLCNIKGLMMQHEDAIYLSGLVSCLQGKTTPPSVHAIREELKLTFKKHELETSELHSLFCFFRNLVLIVFIAYLLALIAKLNIIIYCLTSILFIPFLALLYYGLISCLHDTLHQSFSHKKNVNVFFGMMTASLFMIDFYGFKEDHLLHHKHNQERKSDPKVNIFPDDEKSSAAFSKTSNKPSSGNLFKFLTIKFEELYKHISSEALRTLTLTPIFSLISVLITHCNSDFGISSMFRKKNGFFYKTFLFATLLLHITFFYCPFIMGFFYFI